MYAFEYALDKQGRRVLRGLSFEETTEFELLSAARPMDQSPDGSLPDDLRWLELFNKHERVAHQRPPHNSNRSGASVVSSAARGMEPPVRVTANIASRVH